MRFTILKPTSPVDHRALEFISRDHMHTILPPIVECENEEEAVLAVRAAFPNGLCMPFKVKMGVGEAQLLGVIEDIYKQPRMDRDRTGEPAIPFVMFVHAHGGKNPMFDRKKWKLAPKDSTEINLYAAHTFPVELRTSDFEQPLPIPLNMTVTPEGTILMSCQVGEVAMSIEFRDHDAFDQITKMVALFHEQSSVTQVH